MTMALLGQDQEKPPIDTAWTVLDAANDLGDTVTVEACRRVIDANLFAIHEMAAEICGKGCDRIAEHRQCNPALARASAPREKGHGIEAGSGEIQHAGPASDLDLPEVRRHLMV